MNQRAPASLGRVCRGSKGSTLGGTRNMDSFVTKMTGAQCYLFQSECVPRRPERRFGLVEAIGHAAVRAGRRRGLLIDDLIRAQHYRWGYGKTERRGGLAVHAHLELGRQLHRVAGQRLSTGGMAEVLAAHPVLRSCDLLDRRGLLGRPSSRASRCPSPS